MTIKFLVQSNNTLSTTNLPVGRALALTKLGISLGLSQQSRRRSPQNAAERTLGSAPASLEIQSNEDVYKWRGLVMLHTDITDVHKVPHNNTAILKRV